MKQTDIIREYLVKNPDYIWAASKQPVADTLGVANAHVRYVALKLQKEFKEGPPKKQGRPKGSLGKKKLNPIQEIYKASINSLGSKVDIRLGQSNQSGSNSDSIRKAKDILTLEEAIEELKIKWSQDNSGNSGNNQSPKQTYPKPYLGGNPDNVLILGDLHAPFILDGYLEFCREQQEKWDCGTVVCIGDLLDGHSFSYHEKDVDGMSVGDEMAAAKTQLEKVFAMFPVTASLLGNHDLLIIRKLRTAGLSKTFMKSFGEILGAPDTWTFDYQINIHGVNYIHGDKGDAFVIATKSRVSTVQGHLHSKSFVNWSVSEKDSIFGLQVGCGINRKAYAFEYGKSMPAKPVIGVGIVLDKGTTAFPVLMNLD